MRNAYNMLLEPHATEFTNRCSRIRSVLELTGLDKAIGNAAHWQYKQIHAFF